MKKKKRKKKRRRKKKKNNCKKTWPSSNNWVQPLSARYCNWQYYFHHTFLTYIFFWLPTKQNNPPKKSLINIIMPKIVNVLFSRLVFLFILFFFLNRACEYFYWCVTRGARRPVCNNHIYSVLLFWQQTHIHSLSRAARNLDLHTHTLSILHVGSYNVFSPFSFLFCSFFLSISLPLYLFLQVVAFYCLISSLVFQHIIWPCSCSRLYIIFLFLFLCVILCCFFLLDDYARNATIVSQRRKREMKKKGD
jgi:hypothetical protein